MSIIRRAWKVWKEFGQLIGDVVGRVLLTIFYFTLLAPFGLGVRFLSDPLAVKGGTPVTWLPRTTKDLTLEDGRRLF
jgi:hypothetical protein